MLGPIFALASCIDLSVSSVSFTSGMKFLTLALQNASSATRA